MPLCTKALDPVIFAGGGKKPWKSNYYLLLLGAGQ